MARVRRKKRGRLGLLVLAVIVLLLGGSLALLVWLYRGDVEGIFGTKNRGLALPDGGKPSQEIFEEERKQLEDILKRK